MKLVLGLEIHLQLKTKNKMFCGCSADIWQAEPNSHTCPTCLGLPGALPVPNGEAIKYTQMLGLELKSTLKENSKFDRKHYFYPDLPKGYQISQYKEPLCEGGYMDLSSGNRIELERIHLEEDTAKSFHRGNKTLIDFNKSGIPLMEIVTLPTFKSVEDGVEFCQKIRSMVRFMGISDADMEKGQMRIEPNISVRTEEMEKENKLPDYKVEVKNINSFKFMEKAVRAEVARQIEVLESGGGLVQENRGYDEKSGTTLPQRTKEEAHDYRYFPEPDIPPMVFDEKYFEELRENAAELPDAMIARFGKEYGLRREIAARMVNTFGLAATKKFEEMVARGADPQKAANLIINKKEFLEADVKDAIKVLEQVTVVIEDKDKLEKIVSKIVKQNPQAVEDFKKGKESSVEFLLGMAMRETRGKADPTITRELIKDQLGV
ncbi:Asp-tRNA(Asn)/Glu-tRNA(Gln) amidotransferase subunit GatB [bacterium]|nr:Asp-tRNA(Asn)/Glu-tRNA(Gln) amidotransferase subunit GatB [bacterium]